MKLARVDPWFIVASAGSLGYLLRDDDAQRHQEQSKFRRFCVLFLKELLLRLEAFVMVAPEQSRNLLHVIKRDPMLVRYQWRYSILKIFVD